MMPSFSLAALTVLELAPPALIDVAAACGYDYVGIRLLPAMAGGIAYPLMEDGAGLKETLARLDATDITVADLEVVAFRPETEIASFAAFFETGARLGAKNFLIAAYDPDLTRFTDRYAAFCEAAAPYGLTAARMPDAVGMTHAAALSQVALLSEDQSQSGLFPRGQARSGSAAGRFARTQLVATIDGGGLVGRTAGGPARERGRAVLINARLKPLMLRTPERDKHIVNVSAVEGQFYRTSRRRAIRTLTWRKPHST